MKANWFIVVVFFTMGCAPYIPVQEPAHSVNAVSAIEIPEITIRLQHLGNQFEHLVFDLEVINGDSSVEILPGRHITFYSSFKPFPSPVGSLNVHEQSMRQLIEPSRPTPARSPVYVTHMVDRKLKARATTQAIFGLVGAGLMMYDAVKDAKDYHKEKWTKQDASKSAARDLAVMTTLVATDVAGATASQAAEEAYYLPHELFPDVQLKADGNQRGKIFFPIENNHRYARIIITLPYGDYVFDFKRRGVK